MAFIAQIRKSNAHNHKTHLIPLILEAFAAKAGLRCGPTGPETDDEVCIRQTSDKAIMMPNFQEPSNAISGAKTTSVPFDVHRSRLPCRYPDHVAVASPESMFRPWLWLFVAAGAVSLEVPSNSG